MPGFYFQSIVFPVFNTFVIQHCAHIIVILMLISTIVIIYKWSHAQCCVTVQQLYCATLRQCSGLELDESSFTGETVPCQKKSDPVLTTKGELAELTNIAFMGTLVCNGHGRGVVIGTGYNTQFGEIFTLMESEVWD